MTDADPPRPEQADGFSLALNFWPLAHLASGVGLAALGAEGGAGRLALFALWLYLAPPLLARALIAAYGRPHGRLTLDMRDYRVWWALTQLQTVFNRLPFLEELLRLAPGLYALWIALWGGRVSPRAYVGPGVIITDRYATTVEPGAVLGFGSVLAGHMATRDADGRWRVVAAGPRVERDAILGGAAGLGPGAVLRRGALLASGRRVGPFEVFPREGAAGRAPRETAPEEDAPKENAS